MARNFNFAVSFLEDSILQEIVYSNLAIIYDEKDIFRALFPNWTYKIIAYGDDLRIESFTLQVYKNVNDNWVLVEEQQSEQNLSFIAFNPKEEDYYQIKI